MDASNRQAMVARNPRLPMDVNRRPHRTLPAAATDVKSALNMALATRSHTVRLECLVALEARRNRMEVVRLKATDAAVTMKKTKTHRADSMDLAEVMVDRPAMARKVMVGGTKFVLSRYVLVFMYGDWCW